MAERQINTEAEAVQAVDPIDELRARLDEAEKQRDDYLTLLKEKAAEFENYQKRNAREREVERKYWNFALAHDLLPAIDNLERALAAAKTAAGDDTMIKGVASTHRQLLDILGRHGITRIDAKPGDPLDPNQHQAVMQESSAEIPAGAIVQIFHSGYKIHDRILRPTGVSVSKGPE